MLLKKMRPLSFVIILALLVGLVPAFQSYVIPEAEASNAYGARSFPQQANTNYAVTRVMPSGRTQTQMNQDVIDQFAKLIPEFLVDYDSSRRDTMNNPDSFRMILSMFGGTGPGIDGIGVTTTETMGYGMLILAYMAGCEEAVVSSGVTTINPHTTSTSTTYNIGGKKIKDILKECLPTSLRNAYGNRDVTIKDYFDGMYRTMAYFPTNSGGNNLMAWALTSSGRGRPLNSPLARTSGPSTATDGDLDMAYAMLLAAEQWGHSAKATGASQTYRVRALAMIDDIYKNDVDSQVGTSSRYFLRIGNWTGTTSTTGTKANTTRPSDFMLQHLRAFAAVDNTLVNGTNRWQLVIDSTMQGMGQIYNQNNTGVLPDFIVVTRGSSQSAMTWNPAPANHHESSNDGHHWYNSCRVPWRLGLDALHHNNKTAVKNLHDRGLQKLYNTMLTASGSTWSNMGGVNFSTGAKIGTDAATFAPSTMVAAAVYGNSTQMNNAWTYSRGMTVTTGRGYGSYINLLSMIAASGNWWDPSVTTSNVAVTSISLSGTNTITTNGGTTTFTATVNPSNATNKNVTWSSSNTAVATVNSSGVVTAVGNGSATITATSVSNTGISGTRTVTVSNQSGGGSGQTTVNVWSGSRTITTGQWDNAHQIAATAYTWDPGGVFASMDMSLLGNPDAKLIIEYTGSRTITLNLRSNLNWSTATATAPNSASNGVATFNGDSILSAMKTAYGSGATLNDLDYFHIYATGGSGNNTITKVYVTYGSSNVAVTSISLSGTNTITTKGGTTTFTATVNPSNATNKNVTWSSSNTAVATVNSSGVVTAVGNGSATITATSVSNTGISGTRTVTVSNQSNTVNVWSGSRTITTGQWDNAHQIAATAYTWDPGGVFASMDMSLLGNSGAILHIEYTGSRTITLNLRSNLNWSTATATAPSSTTTGTTNTASFTGSSILSAMKTAYGSGATLNDLDYFHIYATGGSGNNTITKVYVTY